MKKKKKLVIYFTAFVVLAAGIKYKINKDARNLEKKIKIVTEKIHDDDYLIASHRGFSSLAVENTREAIILASNENYIDSIEFDVRMTKDRKIVLSHDDCLFTGILGNSISSLTYEEIKEKEFIYYNFYFPEISLSAEGSLKNQRELNLFGKNFKVIDLIEALSYCKDKMVLVDIKFENNIVEFTNEMKNELQNVDTSNIVFQSLDLEGIKYFQEHTPFKCQVLISSKKDFAYFKYFQSIGLSYKLVSYELVDSLLSQGKSVSIWTINSASTMSKLMDELDNHYKDVTYITNYPDLIVTMLEERSAKTLLKK